MIANPHALAWLTPHRAMLAGYGMGDDSGIDPLTGELEDSGSIDIGTLPTDLSSTDLSAIDTELQAEPGDAYFGNPLDLTTAGNSPIQTTLTAAQLAQLAANTALPLTSAALKAAGATQLQPIATPAASSSWLAQPSTLVAGWTNESVLAAGGAAVIGVAILAGALKGKR